MILKTIKKREDFLKISKSDIKYFSKNVIITCQKIENEQLIDDDIRYIGYVVTKKVGNAVFRNKIKRRLRHIFADNKSLMNPQFYYIVFAKSNIKNNQFFDIEKDVKFCLKRLKSKLSFK
ncbi:ribonuclease P protein component [Rickettsiales bacterium]|nr:ribonuclease P protein component [Rickettsiales bacterium]